MSILLNVALTIVSESVPLLLLMMMLAARTEFVRSWGREWVSMMRPAKQRDVVAIAMRGLQLTGSVAVLERLMLIVGYPL